jgi:DNA repair protein RadA/Sms
MAKPKVSFICTECGCRQPRWFGRCPECESWNTACEEELGGEGNRSRAVASRSAEPLLAVSVNEHPRIASGMEDLDRVLGGGLAPGSSLLLGGEPGIGKSTLLLCALDAWVGRGHKGLYISGEESAAQCRMRAERIGVSSAELLFLSETRLEEILGQIDSQRPEVMILDSIQSVSHDAIASGPGSIVQVRECASMLVRKCKQVGCSLFLVGHVTKDGQLAGPRLLEHLVDTVLYMECDANQHYLLLRGIKNRFGSTNEVAVFEMGGKGLKPIENTSSLFLDETHPDAAGQALTVSMAGSRPFLFEVQALCSPNGGFGAPRRNCTGIDPNRMSMLLAILERHGGLHFSTQDVYANVVGGFRTEETAADLAWLAAFSSALLGRSWGRETVIFGEVGLGGEIRSVGQLDRRVQEIENLGYKRCILPGGSQKEKSHTRLELCYINKVEELLQLIV